MSSPKTEPDSEEPLSSSRGDSTRQTKQPLPQKSATTARKCDGILQLTRISPQSSAALRNVGAGADLVGRGQALHFGMAAKMKGMTPTVDPASPANRLDSRASTRPSFARYELGKLSHSLGSEMSGLISSYSRIPFPAKHP